MLKDNLYDRLKTDIKKELHQFTEKFPASGECLIKTLKNEEWFSEIRYYDFRELHKFARNTGHYSLSDLEHFSNYFTDRQYS